MSNDRRSDALGNLRVLPDEILCSILTVLEPRDVGRLSCVSSVMYILCNEEPLWMSLCIRVVNRPLEYKGSWRNTVLHQLDLPNACIEACKKPLSFDGFNSLFLYRRLYRCYTTLNGFSFDNGNVERRDHISLEEFSKEYDGKKPIMINGLADNWPARKSWTTEQLLQKYPDTKFRISQRSAKKISMKFKDYLSYTQVQRDEDPLYVFDDKFGEVAPDLLKDYSVPHLFQEDYFDVLDMEERPAFRWLIIGPERSGASWHVDPALTSAWNTLLSGRKRWALYPPGRVPLGVTVHVNEDDGDVNIDTPTSLQWWLDCYPLLADEDKPIECTQLPGETIYVPSGWWHCVLNLETSIAVTQNFVNSKNFEYVCLDMAPGFHHKGVTRAGLLALDEGVLEVIEKNNQCRKDTSSYSDLTRKEKRVRICQSDPTSDNNTNETSADSWLANLEYSYDINFLSMFLDKERDHYSSLWSSSNCIGQREMRGWLWKLWVRRPDLRDLIWKGACIALDVGKWSERAAEICNFHGVPSPLPDESLPVGTGSNPVYLVADNVIKIFVEGGLEASLYGLATELEFHDLLNKVNSPLKNYMPNVLASGILIFENGSYKVFPWDGSRTPEGFDSCDLLSTECKEVDFPFGVWGKKQFEHQKAGQPLYESENSGQSSFIWPYIMLKRCEGKIFAEIRDILSSEDSVNLASFLGEQLRNLHLVPVPVHVPFQSPKFSRLMVQEDKTHLSHVNGISEKTPDSNGSSVDRELFISILNRKRKDVSKRLKEWGEPIPNKLIDIVDQYVPQDLTEFLDVFEDEAEFLKSCTWIHSDVMDDNIYMRPCCSGNNSDPCEAGDKISNGSSGQKHSWYPSHILDFSDLSIGDPILDLIPIHLDVFRGDSILLKHFLDSYRLPLIRKESLKESAKDTKFGRLSYRTMCYCIVHEENILGAIFSIWKEARTADSWEEVEERIWGDLNNYAGFS